MKLVILALILGFASVICLAQTEITENDPIEAALIKRLQETTYHALIMGVEDYRDGSGVGDLVNPVKDATKLANLLISHYGFKPADVRLLRNSQLSQ